jgi:hypothetical protein
MLIIEVPILYSAKYFSYELKIRNSRQKFSNSDCIRVSDLLPAAKECPY